MSTCSISSLTPSDWFDRMRQATILRSESSSSSTQTEEKNTSGWRLVEEKPKVEKLPPASRPKEKRKKTGCFLSSQYSEPPEKD